MANQRDRQTGKTKCGPVVAGRRFRRKLLTRGSRFVKRLAELLNGLFDLTRVGSVWEIA